MEPLVGQMLGRYEIVGYLGAGGMGAVYRARDSQLNREVAIKVLPDVRSDRRHLESFRREATVVAKLSHPNILEIFDFGFDHEHPYAVMELLEGDDLRHRMLGRPMPPDKAVNILIAVAEGLAVAHKRGVVHRDIKPENIFITGGGVVKILDFGIARPVPEASESTATGPLTNDVTLTKTGAVTGTVGYMAPEQVRGQKLDGRADIFALGCVAYELLSGRHPFRRASSIDTMLAIVEETPPPLADVVPELPPALVKVVQRCLEKDPNDRFDSARDVAFALQAMLQQKKLLPSPGSRLFEFVKRHALKIAVVTAALVLAVVVGAKLGDLWPSPPPQLPTVKHIGVVPFTTLSDGEEMAQFAAGMTDILAEDLERLAQKSPEGSWTVSGAAARLAEATDADSLYRHFDVNVVVEGDVERHGPILRLELTSIDPGTDGVFRTVEAESDLGNVSSVQIDPVARAAEVVGFEIADDVRDVVVGRTTNVARAFELYVRARGIMTDLSNPGDLDGAIQLLEEAVSLDPLFAAARLSLAEAYATKFAESHDRQYFDKSMEELTRLASDEPSAKVFRIMATLHTSDGVPEKAVADLERAAELSQQSGAVYQELGAAYQKLGRTEDAERAYHRAMNLRPGFLSSPDALGRLYIGEGKYDAAANSFRHVIDDAPLNKVGYNVLGAIQYIQGDLEASRATFERSIEVDPQGNYFAYANLGTLHFNAARFADAIEAYEEALTISDSDYQVWGNLAFAYAFGAEPEKSREPFNRAINLAEDQLTNEPENVDLLVNLAGYYAMQGSEDSSRDLLDRVVTLEPRDPNVFAKIGETFEDLGNRDAALEWIGRAVDGGIPPAYFTTRPMLRDLVADRRFQVLVGRNAPSPT